MKILLCCFSATGNTVAIAEAIGQRLSERGSRGELGGHYSSLQPATTH